MPPKNSPTAASKDENASGDAAKLARQAALAAKKAEFAAKLALAKAAREKVTAAAGEEDEEEEEGEDEEDEKEEEEEEEQSSSRKSAKQPHSVSTTTRDGSGAAAFQQRAAKLQKRTGDQDASTGVEVDESIIDDLSTTTAAPAKKLELSHYFLPTELGENWQLSPIEFERFGLNLPINTKVDQSVINNELMFPSLPPVWKRDQLYVPESFKNEQSQIPIQERTNKIMYDLDQPSRPHRRLILPQIYPNAVQTEQLNLLANQDLILDELRKTAPLTAGQGDPSIQTLFGRTSGTTANDTSATDIEMKDTSSSSSSSTTSTAAVQAEIDAAASKCYAFDYSLATNRSEFGPFMFHFHARPTVCERERKKSDEQYLNDLLLAKQVQEKVKLLMKAVKHHESQMDVTAAAAAGVETKQSEAEIKLVQYSKVYAHLCASREPTPEDSTSIPTGDFALFLTWFLSEPSHDLKSRQFAGDLLVRFFLLFSVPEDLLTTNEVEEEEHEEKKDGEGEEEEEKEIADGLADEFDEDEAERANGERAAVGGDLKMKKNENGPRVSLGPPLKVSDCTNNLELCRTFSQYSRLEGAADLLANKQTLPSLSRMSRLSAHELAAIKGLLFQFALKKTDEKLLASIVKVLGLISTVEDFSGSWLTYIQALAFAAGTYDQPIRTSVTPPPPNESAEMAFSSLGHPALKYSETYPLPQPYVCFTILFDLCAHQFMFSRHHFAMTNGVYDLIQSIVGTTLIQRLWQPNEEPHILNAVLECSRNSGQAPAINLDGYLTYSIMDLFHRSYVSGDYSRLMRGSLPLSLLMCVDSWDETVLHEGEELALDASQPDVFTPECANWIAPFISRIFKECGSKEWIEQMLVWDQTLWRSLPHIFVEGHDVWDYAIRASPTTIASNYQVQAWSLVSFYATNVVLNPTKTNFDVEATLLDLLSLILPRMESTIDSQWYAWNGGNLIKWKDFDFQTGASIHDRSTEASQYLTTWLDTGFMDANMSGREPESARERLMPVYKSILGSLDIYAMRLKLEEKNEMSWETYDGDSGFPTALQKAINTYMARPPPVPVLEGEVYQHLQELTPFEKINWRYMAESAVRIGLIKVDPTHPLGYSYVDPNLEYDPQQHRDLSPEINLLLESINILEANPGARTSPYINFLRRKVLQWMSESIHLSMRLQALVHLNKHWKELFPLIGQDLDYTAKVELVKSYGVNELEITNVLVDIITDYAFPKRSIHHSYMNFMNECVQSAFPLIRAYSCVILKAMFESCAIEEVPDAFSQYYFAILFEGLEMEAHGIIASGMDDTIQQPSSSTVDFKTVPLAISSSANEFNKRELGAMRLARSLVNLLLSTFKPQPSGTTDPPRSTFQVSFMMPFYERFQLLFTPETKQYRFLTEQFDEINQVMKQIIEPKEKEPEAIKADLSTTGFKFAPTSQFDFSAITTSGPGSEPAKPFVFNFGPPASASGINSSTTPSTLFSGFSLSSTTAVIPDPTHAIEISNSIFDYLVAHSSDYAAVHQYHSTDFEDYRVKYDSQIWFRTLQPLLKLVNPDQNDVSLLIIILTQLLERPQLELKDTVIILHALTPFVALISQRVRISVPSTTSSSQSSMPFTFNLGPSTTSTTASPTTALSSQPFTFNFGSSTASTTAAPTNSSPTPAPFVFNFGNSTTAAPVSNFDAGQGAGQGDQTSSMITIDPNPSGHQLPTIIRSLVDALSRLIQSTDIDRLVDVVIGNLVSAHINQLLLSPSCPTDNIKKWFQEWILACPPNSFQIESDDYLRSPPWLHSTSQQQLNDASNSQSLGVWALPPLKLRFRFLLHLRLTCLHAGPHLGLSARQMLIDYFKSYLSPSTQSQSRQTYLFLISFISEQQKANDPITFLNGFTHLVEPLTLVPSAEWSQTDDLFSDALIRWIFRATMHIEDVFPYEPHQRSQRMVIGRFIFKYLERLSYRSRAYLEDRASTLEKRYQLEQTAKKSFSLTGSSSYPTRSTSTTTGAAGLVSPFDNPFHVPTAIASDNPSASTNLNSNFGPRARSLGTVILHPLHAHPLTHQQIPNNLRPHCSLCGIASPTQYHCLQCSTGPILCQDCCTFTPTKLVEISFELLWKVCASHVRLLAGVFSIIHPFAQLDPDDEAVVEWDSALNQVVPSLNTAVRGLSSHPDRTLFYHAPRKGIRYTCLTCTKSYAETSSYYDPIDDSHWCFNCIQWTDQLTTSVRTRSEFDRIYQLQLNEFHDQQLLTIRPPPSNVVTPVTSEQLQHAVSISVKPNQIRTKAVIYTLGAINKLFVIAPNSMEYHGLLADLSLTPIEFNELKVAHVNDLKRCLECDLSSTASEHLPGLSAWQKAYRSVALLGLFPIKWYEYHQILPSVTQVLTHALEDDVMLVRFQALTYLFRERNQNITRKILRHYFTTCRQQPSQTPTTLDNSRMTIGEKFEYALLHTIGCSDPILRTLARTMYVVRAETVPTLLLMDHLNNKFDVEDTDVIQPPTLPPLTCSLQTIPFIFAFVRENFDSKVMGGIRRTIGAISHALNYPVMEPQLREARAGLGRLIQQKWLSSITFVEKVNGHKATRAYAKLVQEGINNSQPRTPPIPKVVVQFVTKLIVDGLEFIVVDLHEWLRTVSQRSTTETVLLSQLDPDDVNTAIHDTPQLRSTLDAMITLHTILPFLPFHMPTINSYISVATMPKNKLVPSILNLSRLFECMLTRCVKSPLLRRLVIQPYYNLWITCCLLRSFYLIPLLCMESDWSPPFIHLFLNRLRYSDDEDIDIDAIMNPPSPGSIVLLTEILMYPPIVDTADDAISSPTQSTGIISSALSNSLPWLFDHLYEYAMELVQVDTPSEGRIELSKLNELFTRVRSWMSQRQPNKRNGFLSPPPPTVGDTTIPCVFIDSLALMIQTVIQLPQLTPHHQSSETAGESDAPVQLLSYRLVELLPIVLATFNLYATTCLADLDNQCQPLLVSMRNYIRVIHQQLKQEKRSFHTSISSTATHSSTVIVSDSSASVGRLGLIIQLYLPLLSHFYRATYINLVNQIEWYDLVDGLNLNGQPKRQWVWSGVPESQLLDEVSRVY